MRAQVFTAEDHNSDLPEPMRHVKISAEPQLTGTFALPYSYPHSLHLYEQPPILGRWYAEDGDRLPSLTLLKTVGKTLAESLVSTLT